MILAAAIRIGNAPAAARADGSDWPQFKRDAARTGDNPDARLSFPLARTTAVQFPAPIYASPAVVAGRVYVQDADGNLACIVAASNTVQWLTALGGFNNMSSPAVADGKVYVGSTAGAFYVLDASSGKVEARVPAPGGVVAAPAVTPEGAYFCTLDGRLTKCSRRGEVVWSYQAWRLSVTEFAVRGRIITLFAGTSSVHFHRLRDMGEAVEVISKTTAPGNCVPQSGPVMVDDKTYAFQSFDSECGRFYVCAGKSAHHRDVNDTHATPSTRGGRIYRGDKCFEPGEGAPKLLWRVDPQVLYDGGFHSSPALADNVLAIGSERGNVYFLSLSGSETVRKPVWEFATLRAGQVNSAVSSSPAVVDGAVYFGGEDGILYGLSRGGETPLTMAPLPTTQAAIEASQAPARLTGTEWRTAGGDMGYSFVCCDPRIKPPFQVQWKTRIFSSYKCPMIVADGKVFCTGRGGPLTALDAANGRILWRAHHAGVESRPPAIYEDGKLVVMRIPNGQRDSPYVAGVSGGPPGAGIYCHDANTGQVLWHVPLAFKYHLNHDGLAAHQGNVFTIATDPQGRLLALALSLTDGKEAWRREFTELVPKPSKTKPPLPPRFASLIAGGLWCVSLSDLGTAGISPQTGELVWLNTEVFITKRSRIASRNDILVVFAASGDHAFDAATGKPLWKGAAKYSAYTQALSDMYLESHGRQGMYPTATCAWPVHANGYWFAHNSFATAHGDNRMVCIQPKDPAQYDGFLNPKQVVWGFDFLSNACPSPSPAYGRLYYTPNAEGVIYCFVSVESLSGKSPSL